MNQDGKLDRQTYEKGYSTSNKDGKFACHGVGADMTS